jgi:hypothetical protein
MFQRVGLLLVLLMAAVVAPAVAQEDGRLPR